MADVSSSSASPETIDGNIKSPHRRSGRPAIQVDLSKVKTITKQHSRPSLPTPLTEYGLDEKKQARAKARAVRHEKDKKSNSFDQFSDEKERDREKMKNDERYLSVMDDLTKLRNYYYTEYRDMLDTKVEKQRKDIKSQNEIRERKEEKAEERKRRSAHSVKKRNKHHKLEHDDSYLNTIPKSDVYLILGLQEKMVKEGKLKSQHDLDNFWREMRDPKIFLTHFPDGLSATSPIHPQMTLQSDLQSPPLGQISESKESSRPVTHETWAVTQRFHHIHKIADNPSRGSVSSPVKESVLEMERRFPMLEIPQLHCFTMDLGEKPPDPEEIRVQAELKVRAKQRRKFLKKLHKMHQLAMANRAAATRILDKHKDLEFLTEGPQLTDLISEVYFDDYGPPIIPHSTLPPIPLRRSKSDIAQRRKKSAVKKLEDESARSKSSEDISEDLDVNANQQLVLYQPVQPLPLTMDELREDSCIVEAKSLSTNWTNYMNVGTSIFVTA